jgi:hypothetical protein
VQDVVTTEIGRLEEMLARRGSEPELAAGCTRSCGDPRLLAGTRQAGEGDSGLSPGLGDRGPRSARQVRIGDCQDRSAASDPPGVPPVVPECGRGREGDRVALREQPVRCPFPESVEGQSVQGSVRHQHQAMDPLRKTGERRSQELPVKSNRAVVLRPVTPFQEREPLVDGCLESFCVGDAMCQHRVLSDREHPGASVVVRRLRGRLTGPGLEEEHRLVGGERALHLGQARRTELEASEHGESPGHVVVPRRLVGLCLLQRAPHLIALGAQPRIEEPLLQLGDSVVDLHAARPEVGRNLSPPLRGEQVLEEHAGTQPLHDLEGRLRIGRASCRVQHPPRRQLVGEGGRVAVPRTHAGLGLTPSQLLEGVQRPRARRPLPSPGRHSATGRSPRTRSPCARSQACEGRMHRPRASFA